MTDFSLANMVSFTTSNRFHCPHLTGSVGLHTREIHDQVLRGQLPRVPRLGPHPQGTVGLL